MIRTVIRQLLVSLAHIHGSSLIHADIKTTNIICVDDKSLRVKLIDFGNAVSDGDVVEYYSTFEIQTVWFRAPEVAYQRPFGRAIDMWSIGCIMCELWLGRSLFTDMDNHNLIHSILKLRGPPPAQLYSASPIYAEVAHDDFVSLADALLEYDPEDRLTATEALDHSFFRGMYAL
ncbi:kinase-like protein [Coemansia reversa NRRL 1564]|uniref:Kinase-like protein n=1 Tax=Coemansia reversa (strain ATCC 12441 / NRRL 1564) TaxID=763665 RepID=A0A2G5BGK2_COERN|nr:kinase-like protein [Coemansia reversa NRRL 1564]|eukprot:PIA18156.1 kinase-like protein [Coemansia reversa NRRL 1564]